MSTYLITGANRGLGLAFVTEYLTRPQSTVIAAVRDRTHHTAQALYKLHRASSTNLIVIKIDSASDADPFTAIKILESEYRVTILDVVIANAGIANNLPPVVECTSAGLLEHTTVNVLGPVLLFQATLPLLKKSKNPRFVAMGSSAGSIGAMELKPYPNAEYGSTKAMLHWLVRKIHFENEEIVAFPLDPGWVQTDMGNKGAETFGFEKAEITLEESITGMVALIDDATRQKTSGRLMLYTGEESVW